MKKTRATLIEAKRWHKMAGVMQESVEEKKELLVDEGDDEQAEEFEHHDNYVSPEKLIAACQKTPVFRTLVGSEMYDEVISTIYDAVGQYAPHSTPSKRALDMLPSVIDGLRVIGKNQEAEYLAQCVDELNMSLDTGENDRF